MRSWLVAALVIAVALPGCLNGVFSGGVGPRDYLSSSTYRKLVVEIDYATGHKPADELLNFLKGRLQGVVDKPDGVEFQVGESLTDAGRTWSDGDLQSYAADHASLKTEGTTVVMHVLFVAGHSAKDDGDSKVLGITFGAGPIAIFSEQVDGLCNSALIPGTCSTTPFYHSVVLHEMGHALGLVAHGIPMVQPHEDSGHSGHSSNSKSVMYWAVDSSSAFLQLLGNNPPSDFDGDDRADMHAAGGK